VQAASRQEEGGDRGFKVGLEITYSWRDSSSSSRAEQKERFMQRVDAENREKAEREETSPRRGGDTRLEGVHRGKMS